MSERSASGQWRTFVKASLLSGKFFCSSFISVIFPFHFLVSVITSVVDCRSLLQVEWIKDVYDRCSGFMVFIFKCIFRMFITSGFLVFITSVVN